MKADLSKLGVVVLDTCRDTAATATGILARHAAAPEADPLVGGFVATTLGGLGVGRVFVCTSVTAAQRLLADNPIDAIVVHTVAGDEVEVTRALRAGADDAAPYVPVVLVATGADAVRRAYDAGVHDFVAKPIAPAALSNTLAASIAARLPAVA